MEPKHSPDKTILDEPKNVRLCVSCGTSSPQTESSYTLISSRHGWRLSPRVDANGKKVMEWRCPPCWERHRSRSKA